MKKDKGIASISPRTPPPEISADLPSPEPGRSGSLKLAFFAFLAIAALVFGAWWLSRTPEERIALRKDAGNLVNEALADTPLAGMGKAIAPAEKPLPPELINPPTPAGTLSGREVTGTIIAPVDLTPPQGAAAFLEPTETSPDQQAQPDQPSQPDSGQLVASLLGLEKEKPAVTFSQEPVAPATEDSVVRPAYLVSLAQWLASRYRPGSNGGSLAVTPQALNVECGNRLGGAVSGGRSGLLRYAFHPAMLNGLYKLYIDRFMGDLENAARKRGFDESQNRQFHQALAGRALLFAQTLEAVLAVPDLKKRMAQIEQLAQAHVNNSAELTAAVFELDNARTSGAASTLLKAAQLRVDGAAAKTHRSQDDFTRAQSALAAEIRKHAGPGLDEEALLFMAGWALRREAGGDNARQAMQTSVNLLRNLASRLMGQGGES